LIGNITGLICTGGIMDKFGAQGLWISLMLILTFFLSFCLINYTQKFLRGQISRQDLTIFNKNKNEEILI
jgi:hypothetical protein